MSSKLSAMINQETPIWQLTVKQFVELFSSLQPKPVEKKEEVYMTSSEVLSYINVSKSTLARWRKDLYIPYEKKGGIIRYKKSEVDKVLNQ